MKKKVCQFSWAPLLLRAESPHLYPGVRRAGVLLCPVRRPPCASVKVHVVGGGFQSMRLGAVVDRGRVGDDLLQVRVIVAVGMLQVHSVRVVVPPARILCVIHRLHGRETGRPWWTYFSLSTVSSIVIEAIILKKLRTNHEIKSCFWFSSWSAFLLTLCSVFTSCMYLLYVVEFNEDLRFRHNTNVTFLTAEKNIGWLLLWKSHRITKHVSVRVALIVSVRQKTFWTAEQFWGTWTCFIIFCHLR